MSLPRAPYGDLTLRLARDPYRLIGRVAARLGTDAFRGRLMLQETVFLTGADRARLFYESDLSREGAAPAFVQVTLFGRGGVQGLDGEAHRHRKAMFLRILTREAPERLAARLAEALDALADARPARIVVQEEMVRILTRITCDWAGIPLPEAERSLRAAQIVQSVRPRPAGDARIPARRAGPQTRQRLGGGPDRRRPPRRGDAARGLRPARDRLVSRRVRPGAGAERGRGGASERRPPDRGRLRLAHLHGPCSWPPGRGVAGRRRPPNVSPRRCAASTRSSRWRPRSRPAK